MNRESDSLTHQFLSGLLWTTWGKGAKTFLQFLVLAILARLMTPLEFGVVGAALIVVGFSEIITQLGFGPALVQRAKLESRHLQTAFTVSVLLSLLIGLLIWISAALIADFFNYPGIENVIRALAFLFPIRGLSLVADSVAHRELRFKLLANSETVSFVIGYFIFGVGLALLDFGVWALVAANLAAAITKTIILLYRFPPPKHFQPERQAFNELLYFGGGHTIARLANQLALQGDYIVVGRMLGMTALGFYGRAYQLMSVPASVFGQILDNVLFPSLAKMQNEKERLAKAYLRGVSLIALVMLPVSVIAFILAPEIVFLILGTQWSEVVLPFRILVIGLLVRTSYKLSDSLARATGAVYHRAWRQLIYAGLVIGGAAVGQIWGVAGVAGGVLAAVVINFLLMAQMSLKLTGETWTSFAKAHRNAILLAVYIGILTFPTVQLLREINFPALLLLAAMGFLLSIVFLLIIRFAPLHFLGSEGLWMLNVLKSYANNRFSKKKTNE